MRALAVLCGAALFALAAAACNGGASEPPFLIEITPAPDEEPTSTAVPTPTEVLEAPTPPPECDGFDCFRAFAPLIEAALAEDDASFFSERGAQIELTCAGDEQLGPCFDLPADTVLTGIPGAVAQSDAFALFAPDEFAAMLAEWFAAVNPGLSDEYGDGGLTLYALAHRPGDEEAYQAIVTGIITSGPDTFRQARIISFLFVDGRWRLTSELYATIPQTAADWLSGDCDFCYDIWERWEGAP